MLEKNGDNPSNNRTAVLYLAIVSKRKLIQFYFPFKIYVWIMSDGYVQV